MIRAEIHLTPADYKSYQKTFQNYIRKKANPLFGGFWSNLVIWIVLIMLFMFIFQRWNEFDVMTALYVSSVAIIFIGIYILELVRLNRATYPKSDSWYYEPMSYQFDKSGIRCETAVGNSLTEWKGIKDIERDNGVILIFIESNQAYVLPESQLEDPDKLMSQIQHWYSNEDQDND